MKIYTILLISMSLLGYSQASIANNPIYEKISTNLVDKDNIDTLYLNIEDSSSILIKKEFNVSTQEDILKESFKEFVQTLNLENKINGNKISQAQKETLNAFNNALKTNDSVENNIKNITYSLKIPAIKGDELISYLKNNLKTKLIYKNIDYGDIVIKYHPISKTSHSIMLLYSNKESLNNNASNYLYKPDFVNIEYPFEFIVSKKTVGECYKTLLNKININNKVLNVNAVMCHKAKLK